MIYGAKSLGGGSINGGFDGLEMLIEALYEVCTLCKSSLKNIQFINNTFRFCFVFCGRGVYILNSKVLEFSYSRKTDVKVYIIGF